SDYCYDIEMKHALEQHHTNNACVIPIILRPVDWKGAPFANLQALPTDAKPITTWSNQDEAFLDVTRGIRAAIEDLHTPPISRPSAVPSLWKVPYQRNPYFTGQETILNHLHNMLKANKTATLTQAQAISGLGGIGKT